MTTRAKLLLGSVASTVGIFALTMACKAETDFAASTTAAITSARDAVTTPFFANIGLIVIAVASITIVLWGIHWFLGLFRGKRR